MPSFLFCFQTWFGIQFRLFHTGIALRLWPYIHWNMTYSASSQVGSTYSTGGQWNGKGSSTYVGLYPHIVAFIIRRYHSFDDGSKPHDGVAS